MRRDDLLVPLTDALVELGLSERQFYRLRARNQLPPVFLPRLGRRHYASRYLLDAYLKGQGWT